MLIDYQLGQTSIILRVKLRSSSTNNGLTALTNTSSGLIIATIADTESATTAYTQAGSTIDSITTLGTFSAPTTGHCRFKEVDATNHKGIYEIQIDNARFNVANAKSLLISISGVSGMLDCDVTIPLRATNPYDGAAGGMSRLDAAISSRMATFTLPTNFASLVIDTNGRIDLGKWIGNAPAVLTANGYLQTALLRWLTDNAAGTPAALDGSGYVKTDLQSETGTPIETAVQAALTTQGYTTTRAAYLDLISRLSNALTPLTGTVTATGPNSATSFTTSLTSTTANAYQLLAIVFTSGALAGQALPIVSYAVTNGVITVADTGFTGAPGTGDAFTIIAIPTGHQGLSVNERNAISANLLNTAVEASALTVLQALRLIAAEAAGDWDATTGTFRAAGIGNPNPNHNITRITSTLSGGNRTNVSSA